MINKVKWVLGITIVFFLILATNYVDRNNFYRIQESLETIYKDRLLAKNLVFEMSLIAQQKLLASATKDVDFFSTKNRALNGEMNRLIESFRETKLTTKETGVFSDLEANFSKIKELEQAWPDDPAKVAGPGYDQVLAKLNKNIYALSKIQIDEGRRQMFIGRKAIKSINLLTTLEVYALIFLAILVQIIIIYNPKKD